MINHNKNMVGVIQLLVQYVQYTDLVEVGITALDSSFASGNEKFFSPFALAVYTLLVDGFVDKITDYATKWITLCLHVLH